METIKLELSLEQVNTVLGALGELPYVKSFDLINTIQTQAQQQLSPPQAEVKHQPKLEPEAK